MGEGSTCGGEKVSTEAREAHLKIKFKKTRFEVERSKNQLRGSTSTLGSEEETFHSSIHCRRCELELTSQVVSTRPRDLRLRLLL